MKPLSCNLSGSALRDYFSDHLPRLRGTSPHTIQSYRDSLVLLLRFLASHQKRTIADLDLADLDPPGILAFLSYLERERHNAVTTRNVRLAAIHAFFRYVATRHPDQLEPVQRILGIPFKRARQRVVEYLEYDEIEAVLVGIDQSTREGRRDYALLATMFNTGARVQEIVDLRAHDLGPTGDEFARSEALLGERIGQRLVQKICERPREGLAGLVHAARLCHIGRP